MPGGDRTGPWGLGPMTGRAAGYCAGYPAAGYMNPVPGFGLGFGRGGGRGFGRGFWGRGRGFWWRGYTPYPTVPYQTVPYNRPTTPYPDTYPGYSREDEKPYLENLVKELEEELEAVRDRLKELSKKK